MLNYLQTKYNNLKYLTQEVIEDYKSDDKILKSYYDNMILVLIIFILLLTGFNPLNSILEFVFSIGTFLYNYYIFLVILNKIKEYKKLS